MVTDTARSPKIYGLSTRAVAFGLNCIIDNIWLPGPIGVRKFRVSTQTETAERVTSLMLYVTLVIPIWLQLSGGTARSPPEALSGCIVLVRALSLCCDAASGNDHNCHVETPTTIMHFYAWRDGYQASPHDSHGRCTVGASEQYSAAVQVGSEI